MSVVRNNAPVPLEPELEHQILLIAARTGVSRADVIQECVRDRLKGGWFRAPFPNACETSGRSEHEGATSSDRPAERPGEGRLESGVA